MSTDTQPGRDGAGADHDGSARDIGTPPELRWIPAAELSVDHAYQREFASKHNRVLAKLVRTFHWARFAPLVVTPGGSGYLVLDGQHRLEVARRLGLENVPCAVVEAGGTAAQAAAFIGLNCDRVAVNQYALHKAALAAGDERAREIVDVCRAAGVSVPAYPIPAPSLKPGETLALGAIRHGLATAGRDVTVRALRLLRAAAGDAPGEIRSVPLKGVILALRREPEIEDAKIVAFLSRTSSEALELRCRTIGKETGEATVMVLAKEIAALAGTSRGERASGTTRGERASGTTPAPAPKASPAPKVVPQAPVPARPVAVAPAMEMSPIEEVLTLPVNRRCACGAVFQTHRVSEYACPKCRTRSAP